MKGQFRYRAVYATLLGLAVFGAPGVEAANYSARLSASPAQYTGSCPATIHFAGSIQSDSAGRVQYKFIRSDGAFAPIQTLDFATPGVKSVNSTWTLGGARLPRYDGWQAIQIVYPTSVTSNRAAFSLRCSQRLAPAGKLKPALRPMPLNLPDLQVKLAAPASAAPGEDISSAIKLAVYNRGRGLAKGTLSTGGNGYMVDLVLSKDTSVPSGFATYSANFSEDVLLRGGRVSRTGDLAPGAYRNYRVGAVIPADTPAGRYNLCAQVDPAGKVAESNEGNNVTCHPITIQKGKPDLVIRSFGLKSWGRCAPNSAVMTFQVTLANIGSSSSPAITDYALVQVMDGHRNWGNGVKLGAIPAGGSKTVEIPVYYLKTDPGHMVRDAPHPFQARLDPANRVDESNEGNNLSVIRQVGAPKDCK